MKKIRTVFMGTPDFAVPCLDKLINMPSVDVVAVFTQPDKPQGRKMILTPTPVKELALKNNIDIYQPNSLKNDVGINIIKELAPELIVVVAYGKILPKSIIDYPKYGCINVHASILPYYRGAAPIQWAVLNGDSETGVTVMKMDEGIDTGDILLLEKTPIEENETSEELFDRLSIMGANALQKAVDSIDELTPKKQPSGDFGYAKMISRAMSPIDWNMSAKAVHNQIRGLYSWPCATTEIESTTVKILESRLSDLTGKKAGEVLKADSTLIICCGDGNSIEIKKIQPSGKKVMDIKAYLSGHNINKHSFIGD